VLRLKLNLKLHIRERYPSPAADTDTFCWRAATEFDGKKTKTARSQKVKPKNHQHQHHQKSKWQTLRYISAAVDWRRPQQFLNARTPLPNTFTTILKAEKKCFSLFLQLLRFLGFIIAGFVCISFLFFRPACRFF